jgi:phthiodiolone/phenolphthiodiolone dimycocerosates ketoreductase
MLMAGAGPRALDIAARYADGWVIPAPAAFAHVEEYAAKVTEVKQKVEAYGRDPEAFIFGVEAIALIHEDPAAIEDAIDNSEFVASFASIYGRMAHAEWESEDDVELARPRDYNYTLDLLPNEVTQAENDAVMAKVSRAMKSKSFAHGTRQEVTDHWMQYVDAGASWIGFLDFAPFVFGLEEATNCLDRNIDVCRMLKAAAGATATV